MLRFNVLFIIVKYTKVVKNNFLKPRDLLQKESKLKLKTKKPTPRSPEPGMPGICNNTKRQNNLIVT